MMTKVDVWFAVLTIVLVLFAAGILAWLSMPPYDSEHLDGQTRAVVRRLDRLIELEEGRR